jgi:hypothetical protein
MLFRLHCPHSPQNKRYQENGGVADQGGNFMPNSNLWWKRLFHHFRVGIAGNVSHSLPGSLRISG